MSEGTMMGSGIYSQDVTIEIECDECGEFKEYDFVTDDWGNIEQDVTCGKCKHVQSVSREADDSSGDDPDRAHDEMYED